MKKYILLLACVIVLCCSSLRAEDYDIAGLWNIYGTGFVEKSFVRVSLELTGDMTLTTATSEEISNDIISRDLVSKDLLNKNTRFLTAYDINLKISATELEIEAWDDHIPNGIRVPVPLPEMRPTNNDPYVVPISLEHEGLNYQVTLTSTESGKVRITGFVEMDVIGEVEINSDCALWKSGTQRPSLEEETSSGCNSGFGALMITLLAGVVMKIVRN